MFNFLKSKNDPVREHLSTFQDGFTKEQKSAIIGFFVMTAKADGNFHPKEMESIEQSARLLGIEIDDPIHRKTAANGLDYIVKTLMTLNQSQKEWFVVALNSLIGADGIFEQVEINSIINICERLGISEDEFIGIINKSRQLGKMFL